MEYVLFFFFNEPTTPEISLFPRQHALPIPPAARAWGAGRHVRRGRFDGPAVLRLAARQGDRLGARPAARDRKSTRLNSSHANISYAVFCLKKNNKSLLSALLVIFTVFHLCS